MTRAIKHAVGLAAVAAIAAVATSAGCDGSRISADRQPRTAVDSAEQLMYNGRTIITANGIRRGEVSGDTVGTYDAITRFRFRPVEVRFSTPSGRPLAVGAAPEGEYTLATATLVISGNVTLVSDTSGRRITTQAVRYDAVKNQLSSNSSFSVTAGTRTLSGVGFTSDPGLFNVKCAARCVGSLAPVSSTTPRARPPGATAAPPRPPAPSPP